MPIPQSRLIATVQAGQAIESQHIMVCDQIASLVARLRKREITSTDFLRDLEGFVLGPEFAIAHYSKLLEIEAMRYKYTHRKNEYDKQRKARARSEASTGGPIAKAQPGRRPSHITEYDLDTQRELRMARAGQFVDDTADLLDAALAPESAPVGAMQSVAPAIHGFSGLSPATQAQLDAELAQMMAQLGLAPDGTPLALDGAK